jgi:hypothetical protein
MADLKMKETPTFKCETCGYEDYMGNTEVCPVCDPEGNEAQNICFFFEGDTKLCRQDGVACPFSESKKWEDCPKLEGLGKKQ